MQFIFATHNANFHVLGDAEQIVACAYANDLVHVTNGRINCSQQQQKIVYIMEGGEETFRQRKWRCERWKPQSS